MIKESHTSSNNEMPHFLVMCNAWRHDGNDDEMGNFLCESEDLKWVSKTFLFRSVILFNGSNRRVLKSLEYRTRIKGVRISIENFSYGSLLNLIRL